MWSALLAALKSLPLLLKEFAALREAVEKAAVAAENRKIQEVRNEQRQLQADIQRVQSDEDRLALAQRLARLEQRL